MIALLVPTTLVSGQPFTVSFRSEERVAGRLRLTAGTEALEFTMSRDDREPVRSSGHRLRGKEGTVQISDWGDHPVGTELVLRFEGAKRWLTVVEIADEDLPG